MPFLSLCLFTSLENGILFRKKYERTRNLKYFYSKKGAIEGARNAHDETEKLATKKFPFQLIRMNF